MIIFSLLIYYTYTVFVLPLPDFEKQELVTQWYLNLRFRNGSTLLLFSQPKGLPILKPSDVGNMERGDLCKSITCIQYIVLYTRTYEYTRMSNTLIGQHSTLLQAVLLIYEYILVKARGIARQTLNGVAERS